MEIRIADEADRDAVVALWATCGLTRPWNDPVADFRQALAGPTSTVLVGVDGGQLVAAAMAGDDGHRGWVYYVAVRPDVRRHGRGTAIMRAAEGWLRERGCAKVQLMVRDTNSEALGFYELLGYERTAVQVLGRWLDPGDD